MQFFTALLSALALAASTTTASPIAARQNPSAPPQIRYPIGGEDWPIGSSQTVTWDTSLVIPGSIGELFLGNDASGYDDNNPTVLAAGFWLQSGEATFTVPSVGSGDNYYVILTVGESGTVPEPQNRTPDLTVSWP